MALGKKTGGRQAGAKNVQGSYKADLDKLLKDYTPEAIAKGFKKARKKHGKVAIIDHLCDKAYNDTTLALALLKKLTADKKSGEEIRRTEGEWANKTPSDICEEMDNLTTGENPDNLT